MSTTLEAELLLAAERAEARARYWESRASAAEASRLRQRAAWVRELEARWWEQVKQDGSEPAAIALTAWSKLTGPIPAAETAPTERKEP